MNMQLKVPANCRVAHISTLLNRMVNVSTLFLALVPMVLIWIHVNWALGMFLLLFLFNCVCFFIQVGKNSAWMVKWIARVSACKAVELMDHAGRTYYTVAHFDEPHMGWCHVYWQTGVGHVRLLPTGYVHAESESSFVYIWRYVDRADQTELALSYDQPDWSAWTHMDHETKIAHRRAHAH